jgi:DNA-binding CsgD family transcriptional regulator
MPKPKLTQMQREIIRLIADGYDSEGIARELDRGKWTIRDHIRRLCSIYDCTMKDLPRRTGMRQKSPSNAE